jgi:DNA-binding CsgD family transcriptional regulator
VKKTSEGLVYAIVALVLVQLVFSLLFLYDLLSSIFQFRTAPLSWEAHEALEAAGAFGLVLGFVLGLLVLRNLRRELAQVQSRLRVASDGFSQLVEEEFSRWTLSPAESEIALFMLKGLNNAEIAEVTGKKPGTIKAQCNAIFRKSGLANRNQLSSYFIEILMQEPLDTLSRKAS